MIHSFVRFLIDHVFVQMCIHRARINFIGADQTGDDVLEAVDVQVYSATFWINVKQFWQSNAKTMACLVFFSGIVQPIFQMMAVIAIAFAPLTPPVRHRMLSLQELTCKIPLSAFYVEAILLIVFTFDVTAETQPMLGAKYEAAGTVIVTGCIGLVLFLVGQLSFLLIVNQLVIFCTNRLMKLHLCSQFDY